MALEEYIQIEHVSYPFTPETWPQVGEQMELRVAEGWRAGLQQIVAMGYDFSLDETKKPDDTSNMQGAMGKIQHVLLVQWCRAVKQEVKI